MSARGLGLDLAAAPQASIELAQRQEPDRGCFTETFRDAYAVGRKLADRRLTHGARRLTHGARYPDPPWEPWNLSQVARDMDPGEAWRATADAVGLSAPIEQIAQLVRSAPECVRTAGNHPAYEEWLTLRGVFQGYVC